MLQQVLSNLNLKKRLRNLDAFIYNVRFKANNPFKTQRDDYFKKK